MKNIFAFIVVLFTASQFSGQAQSKDFVVTGKVISFEESLGIEGVSVHVKGTTLSTSTKSKGQFTIDVPKENNTLIFELEGYETQEVIITGSKAYQVILKQVGNSVQTSRAINCIITVT